MQTNEKVKLLLKSAKEFSFSIEIKIDYINAKKNCIKMFKKTHEKNIVIKLTETKNSKEFC